MRTFYSADTEFNPASEARAAVIDTHVHFWKYDKIRDAWITDQMRVLQQDYLPEQITMNLRRNGVDGCIAVQADSSEVETRFLLELSKTHDIIRGIVGWVDLCAPNLEQKLSEFAAYPIVKGFRHILQAEPDSFMEKPEFIEGIKRLNEFNFTYDVLIYHYQLKSAIQLLNKLPGQKLIIDHCAKPDIRKHEIVEWKKGMQELAKNPNVYCKVSGLFTEADWKSWSAADFYPYLDVLFEAFGTGRILFGSDWPVILLSGMYVQWKSLIEKYMESYRQEERDQVFGLNAYSFYSL